MQASAICPMLLDEPVMAGVGLGVGGCPGAEGEDDRAELFDGFGRVLRSGSVVCLAGCGDRLEQLLLLGEDDLLLVAEIAEERGAANFGALGDVADRDVVKASREEELLGGLDDVPADSLMPLVIRATLAGSTRTATVSLPDGPGPSYVNLPAPGCWTLRLSWGGHTDRLMLRYVS
jgi:hypothetical protein